MDNDSIFYDKKRFDSVWKRVLESSWMPSSNDSAAMLQFLKDEYSDWQLYSFLKKFSKGEAQQVFAQAADDEHRHFRVLRTRYFILTGNTFSPEEEHAPPSVISLSSILRDRYEEESAGASAYLSAAAKSAKPDISGIYRSFSADETRHSHLMMKLINKIIG